MRNPTLANAVLNLGTMCGLLMTADQSHSSPLDSPSMGTIGIYNQNADCPEAPIWRDHRLTWSEGFNIDGRFKEGAPKTTFRKSPFESLVGSGSGWSSGTSVYGVQVDKLVDAAKVQKRWVPPKISTRPKFDTGFEGVLNTAVNPCVPRKGKPGPSTAPKRDRTREHRRPDPENIEITPSGEKYVRSHGSTVIGSNEASKACVKAIRNLSPVGLADSFIPRLMYSNEQNAAEERFDRECLSGPPPEVSKDVGVLATIDAIHCTGLLVSKRMVLTARHCIFDDVKGVYDSLQMRTDANSMSWRFWANAMGRPELFRSTRVFIPVGLDGKSWVQYAMGGATLSKYDIPEKYWRRDFALVELERDAHQPNEYLFDNPIVGEVLVPVSAYAPAWRGGKVNESPLRTQILGACKVFEVRMDGCVIHGCATAGGASGAPLFVARNVNNKRVNVLVGVHTSGSGAQVGCDAPSWGDGVNFGISADLVFSTLVAK